MRLVKPSSVPERPDRLEYVGLKSIPLQHTLDRRECAGVVLQDNNSLFSHFFSIGSS